MFKSPISTLLPLYCDMNLHISTTDLNTINNTVCILAILVLHSQTLHYVARTHTHAHAHTHAHTKAKPLALLRGHAAQWPALGHLYATQVLWVSAGMPSWGRTSNPQEAVPCLTGEGVGTRSPTWTFTCYIRHDIKVTKMASLTAASSLL